MNNSTTWIRLAMPGLCLSFTVLFVLCLCFCFCIFLRLCHCKTTWMELAATFSFTISQGCAGREKARVNKLMYRLCHRLMEIFTFSPLITSTILSWFHPKKYFLFFFFTRKLISLARNPIEYLFARGIIKSLAHLDLLERFEQRRY